MTGDVRVREFLAAVYGGVDGYLNVRTLPPIEQGFFPVTDVAAVEAFVMPRRDRNAYIGAAVRVNGTDGSLAGCGPLTCLFADLDFKDFPTEGDARAQLAASPLTPSLVVQSGGGLQPYWLLKEPLDLQHEAAEAKTLLRRLSRHLGADLAAAEPARVLRLPNTRNFKYTPPRPVRIETFEPDRRYDPMEFDRWLPDEPRELATVLTGPTPDAIPAGARNAHLTSLAGAMRRRGMTEATLVVALLAENEARCRPPLPESDVRTIAKSVGRYAPDPDSAPRSFVHSLPELLARAAAITKPRDLVEGLIPGDGTVLLHSQPRELKTLITQGLCVALTTGTPAFGLERLHVAEAVPVWFITEEDSAWHVTQRFGEIAHGYGVAPSELQHISAGEGLNLDAPEWQERIISTTREQGYRLIVIDPLRSLTEFADQGPRELKPFALFVRRLIRDTGAVIFIVHHDTKPPANGTDQRRRPQRASGGGIFSIADAPIHVDRVDDRRRMLVPCAYKFSADPPAVTVRLEQGPGWLKLVGEETTDAEPDMAALDLRILDFLKHAPYTYGNKVALGVKARKDQVLDRLKAMATRGLVDSVEESRGVKWFTARAS